MHLHQRSWIPINHLDVFAKTTFLSNLNLLSSSYISYSPRETLEATTLFTSISEPTLDVLNASADANPRSQQLQYCSTHSTDWSKHPS